MKLYPFTSPIILDDTTFITYGGHTGSSTSAQRQAAYLLSEMTVSEDLDTLLLPHTVTGTFTPDLLHPLYLDYGYVNSVSEVDFIDSEETVYYTVSGTANLYVSIRDKERGLLDIDYLVTNCNCQSSTNPYPYQVQVVYTPGLPTGTANQPNCLMALTIYADIILNELVGYGNESSGDIGVQSFRNQEYSEQRVRLFRTSFGSSPRAHLVARLLQNLKKHRYVGL